MPALSNTGRHVLSALASGDYEACAYTDRATGVQRRPLQHKHTQAVENVHTGTFSYLLRQYYIKSIAHTPPDGRIYFTVTEHGRAALEAEASNE